MSAQTKYNQIDKYFVQAVLRDPLHVGTGDTDSKSVDVLVHPITEKPFIQASSITGAIREYLTRNYAGEEISYLFENGRLIFTDAVFNENEDTQIELRPRVSIEPKTGTVLESNVTSGGKSGAKFEMEYVGAGATLAFNVYLYSDKDDGKVGDNNRKIEEALSAINSGIIKFGGQKSNGCGRVKVDKIIKSTYDMTTEDGRKNWKNEGNNESGENIQIESLPAASTDLAYSIVVEAKTESELQVRSIGVTSVQDFNLDSENIINAQGKHIVPGSAFKGIIRSQMDMIARYRLGERQASKLIETCFGVTKQNGEEEANTTGIVTFYDCEIGKPSDAITRSRIHIDKSTGGTFQGALFSERNVKGDKIEFNIDVAKANGNIVEESTALILLALRDLAIGMINIGNGYNVGKGFLTDAIITITDVSTGKVSKIDSQKETVEDEAEIITKCMNALCRKDVK